MPTFTKRIEGGQILLIASVVDGDSRNNYTALLDTGAQRTMLSPKVVKATGLEGIGYVDIIPASGEPIRTKKYRVNLGLPIRQRSATLLAGIELEVAQLPFQPVNFDILLGMDFLMHFHFTMYNDLFILSN